MSLGTGVACHVAEQRKSAAIVLMSPYTSLHQLARDRLPFLYLYPQKMYPSPDIGALALFKRNKQVPVFIWHGARDPVIGVDHSKTLVKICRSPLTLRIGEKQHHGDWSINEMSEEIKLFLKKVEQQSKAS